MIAGGPGGGLKLAVGSHVGAAALGWARSPDIVIAALCPAAAEATWAGPAGQQPKAAVAKAAAMMVRIRRRRGFTGTPQAGVRCPTRSRPP